MVSRVADEAKPFRELLDQLRSQPGYWKHFTILQFTTAMARLMNASPRVSGRKLAQLLGKTPPTVSKALSGGENLTIGTMTEMAGALDAAVHIHVAKKGVAVRWIEASEAHKSGIYFNVTIGTLGFTSESASSSPGHFQTGSVTSESVQYVN
jgi:transcriptional regulator with XRE-family HTH domain